MDFIIFPLFVIIVVGFAIVNLITTKGVTSPRKSPIIERSHRFHEPVGNFEENHADRVGRKLIQHEDPEPGYVILNGKKRRISDCKYL